MFSKIRKNIGKSVHSAAMQDKGNELIEQELPKIQAHFLESVGPAATEVVHDDALMTKCFERAYMLVPLPVRLVVKKQAFVDFCLQNRYRIAGIKGHEVAQ